MAMKNNLTIVALILATVARCSFFQSKTDEPVGPDLSAPAVRETSAGIGSYHASARPLFPSVAPPELAAQTCYELSVDIIGSIDEALFEHWPCVIVDSNGENYDMEWTEESLKKTPTYSLIGSYHGGQKKFHNEGRVCSTKAINWKQRLELICKPKLMPVMVSTSINFFWDYVDPSAPSAPANATPASYQKYRGY